MAEAALKAGAEIKSEPEPKKNEGSAAGAAPEAEAPSTPEEFPRFQAKSD